MHNTTWAPNTMLSSRKKLKSQFHENLWTEEWTDLIQRTLPATVRGPVSQSRGIAVGNKNKIRYNTAYCNSLT